LRKGSLDGIRAAIASGVNLNDLNFEGHTELTRTAGDSRYGPEGSATRVAWLLELGALVSAECPIDGTTSVHAAAEMGYINTLKLLVAVDGKRSLGGFDDVSRTPLICAVDKGHLEAARLLIEAGSDVNAHDEARIGNSALIWAVENKDFPMVSLLVKEGADPNLPGWMMMSALDRAKRGKDSTRHPELRQIYSLLDYVAQHPGSRGRGANAHKPAHRRSR
jgi:ankyrin repeat protein